MVTLTFDNTMTSDPHSQLGQGHAMANMAALAAENRQLRGDYVGATMCEFNFK